MGHRLSYDLDFFLPHGFKAVDMAAALKKSGIAYETNDIVDDPRKANQLHGYVLHGGQRLLANMPWLELMDELGEIVCDPKWNRAKDVYFLQDALYSQIGASAVVDDIWREAEREPEPPQGKRRRMPDRGGPTR